MNSERQVDIELMRILAAFFVIFNHTGNNGFFLFSLYNDHSLQFWLYLTVSIFCEFSVPLFFMITGALMLGRNQEPILRVWSHRVIKMMIILLVWSFFYYMVNVYNDKEIFNLKSFAKRFYDSNWNFSFWYLYAYIPLLMSLPVLQRFAKALSDKEYLYMIGLRLFFTALLPIAQYLLWHDRHNLNTWFRISWLECNILFYPLIGYFLQFRIKEFWNRRRLLALWGG